MKVSRVLMSSCAVLAWMTASPVVAAQVKAKRISPTDAPSVVRQYKVPSGTVALNQPPNGVNGFFSDPSCGLCGGQQAIADNWSVNSPGGSFQVNQIIMWGGYFPGNTPNPTDAFTVLIHSDGGGVPGPVVFTFNGPATSRIQTGVIIFGTNEWLFTFDFAAPANLANGTYYVEVINNTAGNPAGDDFYWETGNPGTGSLFDAFFAFEAPGVNWNSGLGSDLSIMITGTDTPVELQGFSVE